MLSHGILSPMHMGSEKKAVRMEVGENASHFEEPPPPREQRTMRQTCIIYMAFINFGSSEAFSLRSNGTLKASSLSTSSMQCPCFPRGLERSHCMNQGVWWCRGCGPSIETPCSRLDSELRWDKTECEDSSLTHSSYRQA
uniref:(California timema) hypothetical protein n=1 Tax=Timema californicum TaxID=61474 RepID=A0A7R9IWW4_TIMCA|nr:unnamed protein product [Timema californicum]